MKRAALGILSVTLLAGCWDDDRLAGGGGVDVEGITVEGRALYPDGKPAAGARVHLRAWDYVAPSALPKPALDRADTLADAQGRFSIAGLDTGLYAIELEAGEEASALVRVHADGSEALLRVDGTLWETGTVSGRILGGDGLPLAGADVAVYGLDRRLKTDDSGAFSFVILPPGSYTFKVIPPSASLASVDIPEVDVAPGSSVALDTVVLPDAIPGLIAQWSFDEGKGNVATEASGSAARAILYGARWASGRKGQALVLGDSAYADVPKSKAASLSLPAGQDFTLSAWIKADPGASATGARRIADTRVAYAPWGYALGLSDGVAELVIRGAGETLETRLAGGGRIDDGAWHHLAAGRSGDTLFLYVDGARAQTLAGTSGALVAEQPLYIGSREGGSEFFLGMIDDLRLYGRALGADEAKALAAE